jgi:hypothetical protein
MTSRSNVVSLPPGPGVLLRFSPVTEDTVLSALDRALSQNKSLRDEMEEQLLVNEIDIDKILLQFDL